MKNKDYQLLKKKYPKKNIDRKEVDCHRSVLFKVMAHQLNSFDFVFFLKYIIILENLYKSIRKEQYPHTKTVKKSPRKIVKKSPKEMLKSPSTSWNGFNFSKLIKPLLQ